jgi:hypothetical protein
VCSEVRGETFQLVRHRAPLRFSPARIHPHHRERFPARVANDRCVCGTVLHEVVRCADSRFPSTGPSDTWRWIVLARDRRVSYAAADAGLRFRSELFATPAPKRVKAQNGASLYNASQGTGDKNQSA